MALAINPQVGDYVRTTLWDEDGIAGLVVEVLDPTEYWSRALGRYPDYVLKVLKDDGAVIIWDVFNYAGEDPEIEIVIEARARSES